MRTRLRRRFDGGTAEVKIEGDPEFVALMLASIERQFALERYLEANMRAQPGYRPPRPPRPCGCGGSGG